MPHTFQSRPLPFDARIDFKLVTRFVTRLVERRWGLFGRIGLGFFGTLVAQAT